MPTTNYTREEVAARGEAIYNQRIRPRIQSHDRGKYVVLDIETGDYVMDESDLAATKQLLAKRPEGTLYGLRVGYPAAYRLGGSSRVSSP